MAKQKVTNAQVKRVKGDIDKAMAELNETLILLEQMDEEQEFEWLRASPMVGNGFLDEEYSENLDQTEKAVEVSLQGARSAVAYLDQAYKTLRSIDI